MVNHPKERTTKKKVRDMKTNNPISQKSETYRTHDGCLPLEHVVASRASAARRGRVTAEIDQLLQVPMLHTTAASQEETSMSAHASKGR